MTDHRRVSLDSHLPTGLSALKLASSAARGAAVEAGMSERFVLLLKIRIAQLNGSAQHLREYTAALLQAGEDPYRIAVLPGWDETEYFSAEEQAALLLAEAITFVAVGHVSEEIYRRALETLGEDRLAAVSWIAVVENALNRVAVASRGLISPRD